MYKCVFHEVGNLLQQHNALRYIRRCNYFYRNFVICQYDSILLWEFVSLRSRKTYLQMLAQMHRFIAKEQKPTEGRVCQITRLTWMESGC